ncbi:MAG: C39 family peptidase [Syntrophobacteraceae bacterium]
MYAGGFSFAQFKAEIDAGRPVFLNLEGHSIVGVGYDDSTNKVYIHDTWDYSNHTMTWGGSYSGMALQSVSMVNLDPLPVVTFSINNRAVLTTSHTVILNNTVTSSTPTHYMASESPSFAETSWQAYSTSSSFTLSPGNGAKTVYFKVKNELGTESAVVYDSIQLTTAQSGPYTTSTVPYAFEDISATGTDLYLIDESSATLSIPFSFKFYETAHSSISINSNGALYFGDNEFESSNKCIPGAGPAEEFMALLWDDLDPGPYGHGSVKYQVLGSSPSRRLVVQWTDVPHYFSDSGGWGTFQVILYEGSDHILFQYKDVDFGKVAHNFGMSATVGIQRDSITAIQYSCNTADLSNGLAIGFAPNRKGALDFIYYLLLN